VIPARALAKLELQAAPDPNPKRSTGSSSAIGARITTSPSAQESRAISAKPALVKSREPRNGDASARVCKRALVRRSILRSGGTISVVNAFPNILGYRLY